MPVRQKGKGSERSRGCQMTVQIQLLWRREGRKEDWTSRISDCNTVLRKFQPSHQGVLKPKSPIRGVPISWEWALPYSCHVQSLAGNCLLKEYLQLQCIDGSRGPAVRPSVNYAPQARDLSGTFSWLPQKPNDHSAWFIGKSSPAATLT